MLSVSGLQSLTFNLLHMYRSFTIKTIEGVEYFIMFSQFHGEFSDGVLKTLAPLFVKSPESEKDFSVSILQQIERGYNCEDCPFSFRVQEMEFFCKTFSLFNPNIENYEKASSFPSSD